MWLYKGQELTEVPNGAYGFIYKITHFGEDYSEQLFYIGKKNFYSELTVKKGKKELAARVDKRESKVKHVVKESSWKTYQSSNEFLKTANPDSLRKEILHICYSKTELTYFETKFLFVEEVLERKNYLNSNILGKFYKTK